MESALGNGKSLERSWTSASPLTRYAVSAFGLLLLLFVGPALRTSASQDQQNTALLFEPTQPFIHPSEAPERNGEQHTILGLNLAPPPFEPEVVLPARSTARVRSLPRQSPEPSHTVAPTASLPPPPPVVDPVVTEAPAPVEPTPVPAANLEIVFKNRLKNAEVSVWIDEEKVWSRNVVAPKSVFKRAVGHNVFTLLPIDEGSHVIDVRVIGIEGKVDVVRRTEAEFLGGETKRLKVAMVPPKKLKLSWVKQNHG